MSHCSFCEDEQPEQLITFCYCKGGIAICKQCLVDEKFTDNVQCNRCRQKYGHIMRNMRTQLNGKTQAMRFSFGSKQTNQDEMPNSLPYQQMPHPGQMYSSEIASSKKKSTNPKPTPENQQYNFPNSGYPNFGGHNMPNYPMHPFMQQQQYMPHQFNPNMMPYWQQPQFYNYPPMMMQPNFNWYSSQPPPNYGQNSSFQHPKVENKFEYDVYNGLALHAERVVTPVKRNNEDDEDEENHMGRHLNANFPFRAQNKTTDYLEETTTRNRSTRVNRSNSVNSLSLRR